MIGPKIPDPKLNPGNSASTGSQGESGARFGLPGPAGRLWAEFEFCVVRVQFTEPELTYREEGDKTIVCAEYQAKCILPPGKGLRNP